MRKWKFAAVAAWMASLALPVLAVEAPPIPELRNPKAYESVPLPWRDYLIQARAAERIADPLQRCLAFPDLPGNKWPKGHSAAHCLLHHEKGIPTVAEIGGMLDRGEMTQLEAAMQKLLDRHFSEIDYSEGIHELFNYRFTDHSQLELIDRVTSEWLRKAPESAFASMARGSYYSGAAGKARGEDYASKTPREDMRYMSELVGKAIPYLEKAISINPRLMPAYTGMIALGRMDSRSELESAEMHGAQKIDPACPELALQVLYSLQPRWGGDYDQMLAYTNTLSAYVARRPQLAVEMAMPYSDRGHMLLVDEQYTREALDVLEIAIGIGSDESAFQDAADVALEVLGEGLGEGRGGIKRLAYLLQESRFKELNAWGNSVIAGYLNGLDPLAEPEWSLKYALRAADLNLDDMSVRYNVGAAYQNMNRFDDAEREFLVVMEGPDARLRRGALRSVAEFRLWGGDTRKPEVRKAKASKAKPYIDRLVEEYPDDGRGWIMRVFQHGFMDSRMDAAVIGEIRAAVKKADRSDPWQVSKVEWLETMLKKIEDSKPQPRSRK
ncbi:hypothetical protein [Thermomonas sp. HDW16]|uniref:hypothetical protein n=1 Tax=Thermomonas sp. HDW16 TaxID=2714945 RepID=UPI0014079301|nr:hypothetical protein [Thermomonas sp. HDW16]QIL20035.1 hypothetical protein G7079_04400 [Thermomonas sp. HDW16]